MCVVQVRGKGMSVTKKKEVKMRLNVKAFALTTAILSSAGSFLYGVYVGIVFVPIYNFINRRWDKNEI